METKMMKVRCPIETCRKVFEVPFEDRVNVVLFGHWHKYHPCVHRLNLEIISKLKRHHCIVEEGCDVETFVKLYDVLAIIDDWKEKHGL